MRGVNCLAVSSRRQAKDRCKAAEQAAGMILRGARPAALLFWAGERIVSSTGPDYRCKAAGGLLCFLAYPGMEARNERFDR